MLSVFDSIEDSKGNILIGRPIAKIEKDIRVALIKDLNKFLENIQIIVNILNGILMI